MLSPATLQGEGLWSSASSSKTFREHKCFPNSERSRVDPTQSKEKSPLPYMVVHGYIEKILASFLLTQERWAPRSACSPCGLFQDNSLGPLLEATGKHTERWQSHIGVSSLPLDTLSPIIPYSTCMVLPPTLTQQFWEHCAPYTCPTALIVIHS